jgi:hypothetical protein
MRFRLVVIALALCCVPLSAEARAKTEVSYPFGSVWTTLVRLVRVDLGCTITEKDKEEGYVLFAYADGTRTVPGTIELVRSKRGPQEVISLVVQIPAMPSYVERMVIDRLERKLRDELGAPMQLTRPAPAPPTPAPSPPPEEPSAATAQANTTAPVQDDSEDD